MESFPEFRPLRRMIPPRFLPLAVALGLPWWILLICLVLVLLSAVGFG